MADDFSLRYGDLLTGSYDCVDQIVLDAFFPLGYQPRVTHLVAAAARRQRRRTGQPI